MAEALELREWRDTAARIEVVRAIEAIYGDVQREIESRGPVCWASGRCCNFEKAGHRLYVTGIEAALTINGVGRSASPEGSGGVALTRASLDDAAKRGGCPFQQGHLCGAHQVRPLGCRVFFCDRGAQAWQQDLYEQALARVRALHEAHAIPYRYVEWRALLGAFVDAEPSS